MGDIDATLKKWEGKEHIFYAKVCQKYKLTRELVGQGAAASSAALMESVKEESHEDHVHFLLEMMSDWGVSWDDVVLAGWHPEGTSGAKRGTAPPAEAHLNRHGRRWAERWARSPS